MESPAYRSDLTTIELISEVRELLAKQRSAERLVCRYLADLADRIQTGQDGPRQVRSRISVEDSRVWVFGIRLVEAQRAAVFFRLWRFYPGPPAAGGIE